nr:PAP2 superfamily protein [uncultured bacterium]
MRGGGLPWATLAWAGLLVLSVGLTVAAAVETPLPGDAYLLARGQSLPFPGRTAAEAIRAVTGTQVVMATGAVLALALVALGYRREALFLALGLVLLPLLQTGLKEAVDRPRPGPPWAELRAGYSSPSFPAGHVMSPTFLYGYLLWLAWRGHAPPPWRWPLSLASVVVLPLAGPPNVWLGVHWPSDVLGGWAWGLVLAGAAALGEERARRRRWAPAES